MVCCYKDQMLVATYHLNRNIEDLNLMKLGNDKTNNDLISDFSENVLLDISFKTSA